jgi:hypothetical protein
MCERDGTLGIGDQQWQVAFEEHSWNAISIRNGKERWSTSEREVKLQCISTTNVVRKCNFTTQGSNESNRRIFNLCSAIRPQKVMPGFSKCGLRD